MPHSVDPEQSLPPPLEHASWPEPDVILQVRTGEIKKLGTTGVTSAIYKESRHGEVFVGPTGLKGDQQQYELHGGIDKAIHQYAASHYPTWRREKPDKAHLFNIGAFGENLVTEGLTEDNVCIGDVFAIGQDVVVEVSEPRMPCWKLNQRFEWNNISKRTQKTGRIGWYLRVLNTGTVKAGDRMILLERPNPRWSITNSQRIFHDHFADPRLVAELSELRALGEEIQKKAAGKLNRNPENAIARLRGSVFDWKTYKLIEIKSITPRVKCLTLEPNDRNKKVIHPEFGPYAYVCLRFGESKVFERSYSVVSGDLKQFTIAVALDDHSRGGSRYIHEKLKLGDEVEISRGFGTDDKQQEERLCAERIDRHIFVVGGIGITAFLREIRTLEANNVLYEVHYAVRSMTEAAYGESLPREKICFYAKDSNDRLSVEEVIPKPGDDGRFHAKIYCSGPKTLMDACEKRTQAIGYPSHLLHFESFGDNTPGPLGDPFDVIVEGATDTMHVPAEKTLLEVLNDAGFGIPSSCQAGKCGICSVDLCEGLVEHKGTALPENAKATTMLSCVSRGKSEIKIQVEE